MRHKELTDFKTMNTACWMKYEGRGLSQGNFPLGKVDRSRRNVQIYKWKWIVLGALGCMNNADFEKQLLNDIIVLDVFIICQKSRHVQVI